MYTCYLIFLLKKEELNEFGYDNNVYIQLLTYLINLILINIMETE